MYDMGSSGSYPVVKFFGCQLWLPRKYCKSPVDVPSSAKWSKDQPSSGPWVPSRKRRWIHGKDLGRSAEKASLSCRRGDDWWNKGPEGSGSRKHYIGQPFFLCQGIYPQMEFVTSIDQLHHLGLHFYAGSRLLQYQSPSGLFKMFD